MLRQEQQKAILLKSIPKKQARKKILEYVDNHPGAYTSEIFMTLKLDPRLVYNVLHELEQKDILRAEGLAVEPREKK